MGFLDKARAAAEQATAKAMDSVDQASARAKAGVEDVQRTRELTQAYTELGRTAYGLASRGEIAHPELSEFVQHISELEARGAAAHAAGATAGTAAEPGAESMPPPPATGASVPGTEPLVPPAQTPEPPVGPGPASPPTEPLAPPAGGAQPPTSSGPEGPATP